MAWSVQAGTVHNYNASSQALDMPADVQSGDLLVLYYTSDSPNDITAPSTTDWPILWDNDLNASGNYVARRIADGTEGSTLTVTTAANEAVIAFIIRIRSGGALSASDIENVVSSNQTNTTNSITPSVDDCILVGSVQDDPAGSPSITWDSPAVEVAEGVRANNAICSVAYEIQTTAASGELTHDGGNMCAGIFNVKPVAGGGSLLLPNRSQDTRLRL